MPDTDSPASLLALSDAYWKTSALHAGAMLDVFSTIGDAALTPAEIAAACACDPRAMGMLVKALAAMGLLVGDGGRYRQTAQARTFLDKRSPRYVGSIIRHHHRIMAAWAGLPESIRTGGPQERPMDAAQTAGDREDFLMGMFNLAMAIAPGLAASLDLSGRKRLVDVGGGPGTYAVHFCLAHPGLRASVFDLPTSQAFADGVRRRFGVADRVDFVPGDYLRDPIPGGYDAAWLSQIFHAEDRAGCLTILKKTVAALEPGGLVLIHEFMLDDEGDGPEFAALFALNMLVLTERGQSYAVGEIRDMMAEAGLTDIGLLDFIGPNGSRVLRGTKG
ncbi:SAM-dependent methyltransferase [Desulfovibrio sp. JY]|nr:SAM-dependent methyltransferase [Desulfovibrio sp. JY]